MRIGFSGRGKIIPMIFSLDFILRSSNFLFIFYALITYHYPQKNINFLIYFINPNIESSKLYVPSSRSHLYCFINVYNTYHFTYEMVSKVLISKTGTPFIYNNYRRSTNSSIVNPACLIKPLKVPFDSSL
jgi:hypothetical protein